MTGYIGDNELIKRINLLRKKLEKRLNNGKEPTELKVVEISQELDKLIVEYYKRLQN